MKEKTEPNTLQVAVRAIINNQRNQTQNKNQPKDKVTDQNQSQQHTFDCEQNPRSTFSFESTMRALTLVFLLASLLQLSVFLSASSSRVLTFAYAGTPIIEEDAEDAAGAKQATPPKSHHVVDQITAPPDSDKAVVKRMQSLFAKAKARGVGASGEEPQGKFNRILTVGDMHGDLKQSLELLKDLKIISHQPDYYKNLLAKWARQDRLRAAKGLKPKKRKDTYAEDGVNAELQDQDIAANMLFNKRGELMGGTADEFHWSGGKIMLVVLGDALNVGPDDIAIVQLLKRLTREAAEAGGKVVYVLGNHEMNNLKGNYMGVHPWSFESSGGEDGRRRLLSTETRLGRFLRSRPGLFYYDHLMFMHGGLMPQTIDFIQKTSGRYNMTGREIADTVNTHLKVQLFTFENQPEKMDSDPIAATVTNVDYETNGVGGILLVHPLGKCPLVTEANQMALLQSQIVGHTPHELPEYRFCDGGLYAIDFMLSQWKGGAHTSMSALELTRVALPPSESDPSGTQPAYRWSSRLLIPRKDTLGVLSEAHRITRLGFAALVVLAVAVIEGLIVLTRHVMRRRKALAHFLH